MQAALKHLHQQPRKIREEDEARLSPLVRGHIMVLGNFSFTLAERVMKGQLRPLNLHTDNIAIP